jgi:hypothetical protein
MWCISSNTTLFISRILGITTIGSAQLRVSVGYWVSLQLDQHNYVFRLLIFAIVGLYMELIE